MPRSKGYAFVRDVSQPLFKTASSSIDNQRERIVTNLNVLIVGPESLTMQEANILKSAFEKYGADTNVFRTDGFFRLSDIRSRVEQASHLLLVLDRIDDGHTSAVLLAADTLGSAKIGLLCLYTSESLHRYAKRLADRGVELVIVRSHAEHSRVRTTWPALHTLVADQKNLASSANDIAQAFIGAAARHANMAAAK